MVSLSLIKNLCKKPIKTPEKIMEIAEYFLKRDGGGERASNILQMGVNKYPLNENLVHVQSIFSTNPNQSIENIRRLIDENPQNVNNYVIRSGLFTKLGDKQTAVTDLRKAYTLGKKQKYDESFLGEIQEGIAELTGTKKINRLN